MPRKIAGFSRVFSLGNGSCFRAGTARNSPFPSLVRCTGLPRGGPGCGGSHALIVRIEEFPEGGLRRARWTGQRRRLRRTNQHLSADGRTAASRGEGQGQGHEDQGTMQSSGHVVPLPRAGSEASRARSRRTSATAAFAAVRAFRAARRWRPTACADAALISLRSLNSAASPAAVESRYWSHARPRASRTGTTIGRSAPDSSREDIIGPRFRSGGRSFGRTCRSGGR